MHIIFNELQATCFGLLMNQVSNAAHMLGSQYVYSWCSLIYLQ
jgi:hypothetical protein